MRTTKRFTPTVIARFEKEGRGLGTYEDYVPWHRVSRGDPSSLGRSHLVHWRGRLRELLSDGELGEQLFATMLPNLDDSLEQFRLSVDPSPSPLIAYGEHNDWSLLPGTLQIAGELGIKHPVLRGSGATEPWHLTTDLLLVFSAPPASRKMLALAFKPLDWQANPRTVQLLRLEREYWVRRDVPWLLVTPSLCDQRTVLTLRRVACWGLGQSVLPELLQLAVTTARERPDRTVTQVLQAICSYTQTLDEAQRALWQAIWSGKLPVDLRRGWRPHVPLHHIGGQDFAQLNPVAMRRSAWI